MRLIVHKLTQIHLIYFVPEYEYLNLTYYAIKKYSKLMIIIMLTYYKALNSLRNNVTDTSFWNTMLIFLETMFLSWLSTLQFKVVWGGSVLGLATTFYEAQYSQSLFSNLHFFDGSFNNFVWMSKAGVKLTSKQKLSRYLQTRHFLFCSYATYLVELSNNTLCLIVLLSKNSGPTLSPCFRISWNTCPHS